MCPTAEMLADFFTKPLQGLLFVKFCDLIMNSVIVPDKKHNRSQECVGEKDLSICSDREYG